MSKKRARKTKNEQKTSNPEFQDPEFQNSRNPCSLFFCTKCMVSTPFWTFLKCPF